MNMLKLCGAPQELQKLVFKRKELKSSHGLDGNGVPMEERLVVGF